MSEQENDPEGLSPTAARLVRAAAKIAEGPPERAGYLHAVLCQVGLPRKSVRSTTFERTNGNASLLIEAGRLWTNGKWQLQPLPYGTRPRLALVHISSQAVLTKSPVVDIGRSVRAFLLRLGIDTGGNEYVGFTQQMRSLAACHMTIGMGEQTIGAKPISRFAAWLTKDERQGALFSGEVELTAEFFSTLREYAVPLDPTALGALKHSSLALDVYSWLAHRLYRVRQPNGTRLSWDNLREQFGGEYNDPRNFKRELLKALVAVRTVYPDARVEKINGGILLRPSRPPVPRLVVPIKGLES